MRHYLLSVTVVLGVCQVASAQQPGGDRDKIDLGQRLQRLEQKLEQLTQQLDEIRQLEKQRQALSGPMGAGAPGAGLGGGPAGLGPMGGGQPGSPPMGGGGGIGGGFGYGQKPRPGGAGGQPPKPFGPGVPRGPMDPAGPMPGFPGGEGPGPAVHIYTLKHAQARDMAKLLRELFDDHHFNLGVDVRTNSLVVLGDLHGVIETILKRLDVPVDDVGAVSPGDEKRFGPDKSKKKFFDPAKKPPDFDKKEKEGVTEALQRLRANVDIARGELTVATQDATRAERLAQQGLLSEAQLVVEQTRLQAAREALRRAEAELHGADTKKAP